MRVPGATFLLNSPYSASEIWDKLPKTMQQELIAKKIEFYVIDGYKVARDAGMGGRCAQKKREKAEKFTHGPPRQNADGNNFTGKDTARRWMRARSVQARLLVGGPRVWWVRSREMRRWVLACATAD